MSIIRLPELVDQILHDLSSLGFPIPIQNQYEPAAEQCTLQDPERIAKVLTVFFMQLESARKGCFSRLKWDYREGILSATLLEPCSPEMEGSFINTRTSLHCLGGTLSFEKGHLLLTLPTSNQQSARGPSKDPSKEFSDAPPLQPLDDSATYRLEGSHLEKGTSVFDPDVLKQACPDEEFSRQLMEEFLSHCRNHLQELEHLLTDEHPLDLVKIHRIAHSIKGGGLNVGAFRLAEAARSMEQQAKAGMIGSLEKALTRLKEEERLLESIYREHYERKANPPG
jgi:HPt (histidine-containing phosphotransfer) domain-containing protein